MPWWGFLIFGLVTVTLTAIVVYLVVTRAVESIDRRALKASTKERENVEIEADRKRKTKTEVIAVELRKKLAKNHSVMIKKLEKANAEIDNEYRALVRYDRAILDRLAELIAGGSNDFTDDSTGDPAKLKGKSADPEKGSARGNIGDPTKPVSSSSNR